MDLAYTTSSFFWPSSFQHYGRGETQQYYDVMTGQWMWPRVCTLQEETQFIKPSFFNMAENNKKSRGFDLTGVNIQDAIARSNFPAQSRDRFISTKDNNFTESSPYSTAGISSKSILEFSSDKEIVRFIGTQHFATNSEPSHPEKDENDEIPSQDIPKDTLQLNETSRFKPTRDTKGRFVSHASKKTISKEIQPKEIPRNQIGENPFSCPQCCKTFSYASNLKRHLRSHSGEKPYVCKECNRTFADPSNLGKHLRTHSAAKPYSKCKKTFTDTNSLKKHILTHKHECSECGMTFSNVQKLIEHYRCHSNDGPFVCLQCDKTFSQASSLRNHLNEKHTRGSVIQKA